MSKYDETFGFRLRKIRQHLNLKQKEFAAGLGISSPALSEIENGKYKPGHDFLYHIVESYKVNLYYLLFGEGEMFLEPLSIGGGFSRYSGSNPEMKRFIWYFERSPIVQHFILGQFRRYINDERETIERDANLFVNEADKDFDPFKDRGRE
ncbi:MAG: helix-turn-helix transcriptional regulator [Candidatus Aminicenantes bacterium]|jgi:transcriptional regulator with XRE-family HTH domain